MPLYGLGLLGVTRRLQRYADLRWQPYCLRRSLTMFLRSTCAAAPCSASTTAPRLLGYSWPLLGHAWPCCLTYFSYPLPHRDSYHLSVGQSDAPGVRSSD